MEQLIRDGAWPEVLEGLRRVQDDCSELIPLAIENRAPLRVIEAIVESSNDLDFYGDNPLEVAIRANRRDVVQLLLDKGADFNREDVLQAALMQEALVRVIFENPDLSARLAIQNIVCFTRPNFDFVDIVTRRAGLDACLDAALQVSSLEWTQYFLQLGARVTDDIWNSFWLGNWGCPSYSETNRPQLFVILRLVPFLESVLGRRSAPVSRLPRELLRLLSSYFFAVTK